MIDCHIGLPCLGFTHVPGVRSFDSCNLCRRCPACGAHYVPEYRGASEALGGLRVTLRAVAHPSEHDNETYRAFHFPSA